MNRYISNTLNALKCVPHKLVIFLIGLTALSITSCSTMQGVHARLTYDFKQNSDDKRVFYETGTEDAVALVSAQLDDLIDQIEFA